MYYLQGYLSYIRGLPINDTPEIFGLHDNANISFAQNETFALLGAVLRLQPRAASSGGKAREEVQSHPQGLLQLLSQTFMNSQTMCLRLCPIYEFSPILIYLTLIHTVQGKVKKKKNFMKSQSKTFSFPQIVEEIVTGIVQKIPNPVDIQEVVTKYPVMYEESMNTVLIQEVIRYIHTHIIHRSETGNGSTYSL